MPRVQLRPLPPVKQPSDCWDWLTPDDVLRVALGAYYDACRLAEDPGESGTWLDPELGPATQRAGFLEALELQLRCKFRALAHERRAGEYLDAVTEVQRIERYIAKLQTKKTPSILGPKPDIHCRLSRNENP